MRTPSLLLLLGQLAAAAPGAQPVPPRAAADAGVEVERTVQPLAVDRQVTPEAVRLGEPFVYRITIHHPAAQRWELRTPRELGGFELLAQSRTRSDGKGESATTYLLRMSLFALGSHVLPPSPSTWWSRRAGGWPASTARTSRRRAACGRTPTSSAPSSRTSSPTRTCRSAAGGCSGGCWGSSPSPRSPGSLAAPGSPGRGGLPRPRPRRRSRSAPGRRSTRSRPRGCPSAGCSASSTSG